MPILVSLGPAHHWIAQWPIFFVVSCACLYACYFTVARINIPQLIISKKYWKIGGTLALLVAVNYLVSLYPLPDMDFVTPALSAYQTRVRNFGISVTLWLMFSLVMGYALTISFVKELYGQLLLRKKLEIQRDRARLAVFKAQISPHFLFNTLNSLYSLVIGTSQKAEDAFIKFTEILKYTYVTVEKDWVPLRDEIVHISNYIDLQSVRLDSHTKVDWRYTADDEDVDVPPLLMLTFVENAFKYGTSTSCECTIGIRLTMRDGRLEFRTWNTLMKHADQFRKDIPVGIDNCRARLAALFPGRHSLSAEEENGVFKVVLSIHLNT